MKPTKGSTAIGYGPNFEPPAKEMLEKLYRLYNSRQWVHPDPLEFLYNYENPEDREIVGFIASSLAYGRVAQILVSVGRVLDPMGRRPARFLDESLPEQLIPRFESFVHRFTTGFDLTLMLTGLKRVRERFGSLQNCFLSGYSRSDDTVIPALNLLISEIGKTPDGRCRRNSLLPSPDKGSACKRHHLFLRWMVRSDIVDPGGWEAVSPSKLIIPLDTHMYRICSSWGFTERKSSGGAAALDITRAFRKITPEDPVRYDFALTRLGIRKDLDAQILFCGR
ncbi:MAG: TIGR02757 family protein [Desulfatiglandaceae bacterium]